MLEDEKDFSFVIDCVKRELECYTNNNKSGGIDFSVKITRGFPYLLTIIKKETKKISQKKKRT